MFQENDHPPQRKLTIPSPSFMTTYAMSRHSLEPLSPDEGNVLHGWVVDIFFL